VIFAVYARYLKRISVVPDTGAVTVTEAPDVHEHEPLQMAQETSYPAGCVELTV